MKFETVRLSLVDLLGREYIGAVLESRAFLTGESRADLDRAANEPIDFFSPDFQRRIVGLLPKVGQKVVPGLEKSAPGCSSKAFESSTRKDRAPLGGLGPYRVGEDGRLYLIAKSEHYHAPLGHSFPGYRLLEKARALGIPNATHNSTRGHITRLVEEDLVRTANGVARGDRRELKGVCARTDETVVDRVLNLETGSLAAEAALKMMLSRFYRIQPDSPPPPYERREPVLLVMGSDDGGLQANYHGTTILDQMLRGMWDGLLAKWTDSGALRIHPVRPNSMDNLEEAFRKFENGRTKIAGFCHELIMMNYGARRLTARFIHRAYELCALHDVPTLVDEIQSCVWSPELYMFREYGIRPWLVAVGKGFPGGEFAASRLLYSTRLDTLPQFGALVTNGQEEIASLAYLVTMRWAEENAEVTRSLGDYYEERLREECGRYPEIVSEVEGKRHLTGISFNDLDAATVFSKYLNRRGVDISVQTYKTSVPPTALTKIPLISGVEVIDWLIDQISEALKEVSHGNRRDL
ncbi:aminotransferase class III-fold pyridoxal phosphate-dependent enzyme [bacterium]|nr:aminotransferase class III-fold pyridoxal phosphate-dependent enzyme [bacterium]